MRLGGRRWDAADRRLKELLYLLVAHAYLVTRGGVALLVRMAQLALFASASAAHGDESDEAARRRTLLLWSVHALSAAIVVHDLVWPVQLTLMVHVFEDAPRGRWLAVWCDALLGLLLWQWPRLVKG